MPPKNNSLPLVGKGVKLLMAGHNGSGCHNRMTAYEKEETRHFHGITLCLGCQGFLFVC